MINKENAYMEPNDKIQLFENQHILDKCTIPLLRLRTDGSGEKEKIKNALKRD